MFIDIHDMGSKGEGVGKQEGFTWFVLGAVMGDRVHIEPTRRHKRYGYAKLLDIHTPSPHRVTPPCEVFEQCGGCQLQALDDASQLAFKYRKVTTAFRQFAQRDDSVIEPIIPNPKSYGYRNKVQLPVGKSADGLVLGFYARHSHDLVPITTCLIQDPVIQKLMPDLRSLIRGWGIEAYHETTATGELRHVGVRVNSKGEYVLIFVTNRSGFDYPIPHWEGCVGVLHNVHPDANNVIYGAHSVCLRGQPWLQQEVLGKVYRYGALSFFQVNADLVPTMVQLVLDYLGLDEHSRVLDLYCGVGLFAIAAGDKASTVVGVEYHAESVDYAVKNATLNGMTSIQFVQADVTAWMQYASEDFTHVILDPPRKGCDPSVLEQLGRLRIQTIVYVSCDPVTLARDCALLVHYGYDIKRVQPLDLFAQTIHVETVALLELSPH